MTEKELHLIDKSALVAEIENKIMKYTKRGEESDAKRDGYGMYWGGVLSCLNEVRTICDTFETIEVNLNSEFAWKPADGDELPEIDREVIALIPAYDGWKVVFAHRPDPIGYWGKSILSDEYEHFQPETYDGWNIPNIKWWLDLDLPNMED